MNTWYTGHHHAHCGHGELIGGQLVSGFELPIRAERLRGAFNAATLGTLREPRDLGLAPILAVHDATYVDFLRHAWTEWRALRRTHPALGMISRAGMGLARIAPRHIEGRLGFYSFDAGCAIGRRLRRLGVLLLFVFECGYATDEVGHNAAAILLGFERG